MNEEEHEKCVIVTNAILKGVTTLANQVLAHARKSEGVTQDMEDLIRTMLTEQARFWKGY